MMDREQFRKAGYAAIDDICDLFSEIDGRQVKPDVRPGYLRRQLPDKAPQDGQEWEEIKQDVRSQIMPGLLNFQHPRFFGFFPTAVSYPSILGELYSAALSSPGFTWQCSPSQTELEMIVMDWLADMLHLPAVFKSTTSGGGVISGSASESIVTVMIAARERAVIEACQDIAGPQKEATADRTRARLVALGSDQSHSSTAKAAIIAGVKFRTVPTTLAENLSMTAKAFQRVIDECHRDGLIPFYVTLTLGSTSTCAVDDLLGISAALAENQSSPAIWTHVDAAWAGSALILDEYADLLCPRLQQVDSFCVNMHKWLLVNFDASCLFVRRREALTDVLTLTPAYLRDKYNAEGLVTDYKDWQISLGRRFRSLKVWFVMRSYGIRGLQHHVQSHINLGRDFADKIRARSDLFRLIAEPAFALTVFIVIPRERNSGEPMNVEDRLGDPSVQAQANRLTESVYDVLDASREIYLTKTKVAGLCAIRVISATENTNADRLDYAFKLIVSATEATIAKTRMDDDSRGAT